MGLSWLPYGAAQPSHNEPLRPSTGPCLPLLVRPPAPTIQPAVAIPCLVAGLLVTAIIGIWHVPQADAAPLAGAPSAHTGVSASPSVDPMFPASVRAWEQQIYHWAAAYGIPVDLVAVVMTLESCGDPSARSSAGAQGLFQVMPFHFATDEDPGDPEVNARRGLSYLSRGLQLAGGDMALALAGYNGGHGLIQRDPSTWPSETTRYVRWATGILAELRAGLTSSPTLKAWLDAGGASLCRRAAERLP